MKPILKFTACIFLLWGIFLISCKKERSCEGCREKNQPPIARAGNDTAIILPIDSVTLNGSASTDPDGTITSYRWTKVSGPSSSNITKTDSSKTLVKGLVTGVYEFELSVTDNGGLSAKDTIQVTVTDQLRTNQPPVAKAGKDTIITLPVNTVMLYGSASTDPDNNITNYAWTKISGPSSFNIANVNAVQTPVTNLVQGTYQFELKVTDADGLFAKDTVSVIVFSVTGDCNEVPISIIRGTGTLTPFGSLSQARIVSPATAADKIVFGGGQDGNSYTDRVDIYNLSTNTWSIAALSEPNGGGNITVGNKILFTGGSKVDIYDAAANTWALGSFDLRSRLQGGGGGEAVANNKVFFAGGLISKDSSSSRVDIYDAAANTWSTAALSEARTGITTITVGNKVFFAGGYTKRDILDYPVDPSKRVDIYDESTNKWSTTELPDPGFTSFGGKHGAAAVGNKVLFAFDNIPDHVDIYDIATNSWSTAPLSVPRYSGFVKVITAGNKILVAGGTANVGGVIKAVATVDIYDASANSWSTANLNYPGDVYWFANAGNKLLIWTIQDSFWGGAPMVMDIYDASNNTWSTAELNYLLFSQPIVAGNQIFLGGGIVRTIGSNDYHYTCKVWKFQF